MDTQRFPASPWGALCTLDEIKEAGTSRNAKIAILEKNKKNKHLKLIVDWAYSSENFYVRLSDSFIEKLAAKKIDKEPSDGCRGSFNKFLCLCEDLSAREITGNEARDAVDSFLKDKIISYLETLYYARALNHDLRIGLHRGTFRKVWPEMYKVKASKKSGNPTYLGCMLADKVVGEHKQILPCYAEPKLDGIRLTAICDRKGACLYTRGGNTYPTLHHLEKLLRKKAKGWVLDLEVMAKNWNETSHLFKRHKLTPELKKQIKKEVFLNVFDAFPLKEYYLNEGCTRIPYSKRRKLLKKLLKKIGHPNIRLVFAKKVRTEKEILRFYRKMLSRGYEGIMLKDPHGPYVVVKSSSRPSHWMKLKPEEDETVKIVDVLKGKGRNQDRLGAFVCVSLDKKKEYRVGGGFTDAQRDEFWKHRKKLIGQNIDVKKEKEGANNITVRFPVFAKASKKNALLFKRFRDDL